MRVLFEEILRGRREQEMVKLPETAAEADPRAEADALRKSVEALEARVERLKKSLAELD
jgi:ubiquinone biosynthesis protein UbiJ